MRDRLIRKGIDPDRIRVFQIAANGARRRMTISAFERFMTQDKYVANRSTVSVAARDEPGEEIWCVGLVNPRTGDLEKVIWEFDPRNFQPLEGEE